ncbi:hypothetical protein ACFX16_040001 [Malus domestica]
MPTSAKEKPWYSIEQASVHITVTSTEHDWSTNSEQRTCAVYKSECKRLPQKDENGIDTYDHSNCSAPVHAVIGMAGFTLDGFSSGISEFGYLRGYATKKEMKLELVNADTRKVEDRFHITK